MGQGATFAMIFGAPSKFAALDQFVSDEYHLLQMIFSSECFLQSNYFNKIHWFLPPGTALVSPRADHGQANGSVPGTLFLALCGNASASPAQGWPQTSVLVGQGEAQQAWAAWRHMGSHPCCPSFGQSTFPFPHHPGFL